MPLRRLLYSVPKFNSPLQFNREFSCASVSRKGPSSHVSLDHLRVKVFRLSKVTCRSTENSTPLVTSTLLKRNLDDEFSDQVSYLSPPMERRFTSGSAATEVRFSACFACFLFLVPAFYPPFAQFCLTLSLFDQARPMWVAARAQDSETRMLRLNLLNRSASSR